MTRVKGLFAVTARSPKPHNVNTRAQLNGFGKSSRAGAVNRRATASVVMLNAKGHERPSSIKAVAEGNNATGFHDGSTIESGSCGCKSRMLIHARNANPTAINQADRNVGRATRMITRIDAAANTSIAGMRMSIKYSITVGYLPESESFSAGLEYNLTMGDSHNDDIARQVDFISFEMQS